MRIAYGIHGYGRGHAMRALAVLPRLRSRHEVLVLAGGEAFEALWPEFDVLRVPCFRYFYDGRGRLSTRRTLSHNLPGVLDLRLVGPGLQMTMEALQQFNADVVISDSEAYTHRAAERLGIPRISFDHFGLLVYCRLELGLRDRLVCRGNRLAYRFLFGSPERVIVTSFFDAPPLRPGVRLIGPVIRPEVRAVEPTCGEHLLAYFSQGEAEFTPRIEAALSELDCQVRIYGTRRRGLQGNLLFKPLGNLPFIEDLASSRAVLATAGNQLCGEVLYFGKPMLAMPIDCLEQRLNARQIERMGAGRMVSRDRIDARLLRDFLAHADHYRRRPARACPDAAEEAWAAIEQAMAELVRQPGAARADRPPPHGAAQP